MGKSRKNSICAIIPAYNNEATVSAVVKGARRYLEKVVVIDDGSADRTASMARKEGAKVIRFPVNRGKGCALRAGINYALEKGFEACITIDADLQHDPEDILNLIRCHRERHSKFVVGSRMWDKGRIPRYRYMPNKVGILCFSWLLGFPVEDSQSGFRLYHREVMDNVPIMRDGFEAESDLLLRAGKMGYGIDFVPIKTIYFSIKEGISYYKPVKDTFYICIIFLKNLFGINR